MKVLLTRSYGISSTDRLATEPVPRSKRNFSLLPSSTSQQAEAWDLRWLGIPVPSEMTRISFGPSSSVFG